MIDNIDLIAGVASILSLIFFFVLYNFLENPSYGSNKRRLLQNISYLLIGISGYLISVKLYKLINGMNSLIDIENIIKIISYMCIFGLASYTARVVDQPQCAYDEGFTDDPVFIGLRNISIIGIAGSLLSTGYTLYHMFIKPSQSATNSRKSIINDIFQDIADKRI